MEKSGRPRLRTLLGDFAQATSAHGISNIVSSTSHFWRVLWALGTLACFGMVVHQSFLLLETFLRKPIKSDFDVTYSKMVTFPTVTICNLNIVKESRLKEFPDVKAIITRFNKFADKKPPSNNNTKITPPNISNNTSPPNNNNNNTNITPPNISNNTSPPNNSNNNTNITVITNSTSMPSVNNKTLPTGLPPIGRRRKRRSDPTSDDSSSFGPPDKRKNALKKGITGDSSGAEERVALNNVTFDDQTYAQEQMLSILGNRNDTELKEAGHSFEELVYRCTWNGFSCNEGDFKKYWRSIWNWRYGNCYMFNSGMTQDGKKATVLTSAKPGPSYGMTLDLFIDQNEYVGALSQEAGVRVLLKDQRNIPFPVNEGFTAAPGFSTSVGVRKLAINRVDPFNNHSCWAPEELEDWSIYKRHKGGKYSVQGCMYSCLARAQIDACNCTQGKFRFGKMVCTSDDETECVMGVVEKYDNHQLGCIEKCPQPCEHFSFRTTISTSKWSENYEKQVQMLMRRKGDKNKDKFADSKDMLRSNFLRVKIYFDELNLERIAYSEYYAIENLLGDVGGQMGLWIGISVLTLAEFLKLLYDIFGYLVARISRTRSTEVKDIDLTEQRTN